MSTLIIESTVVRQDSSGRYCLNDLHRASGGAEKHAPAKFFRTDNAEALVRELENGHICPVSTSMGRNGGTYVCKELVYAYAMWISPKFHLLVIRTFDALVTGQVAQDIDDGDFRHQADQVVSAGRVFRTLFTVGRSVGLSRRMAATRANQAAARVCGVDLVAEIGATASLANADLPEPQSYRYQVQVQVRQFLEDTGWPSGFTNEFVRRGIGLGDDHRTQQAVGAALLQLGYRRCKLASGPRGNRPLGYELVERPPLPACA